MGTVIVFNDGILEGTGKTSDENGKEKDCCKEVLASLSELRNLMIEQKYLLKNEVKQIGRYESRLSSKDLFELALEIRKMKMGMLDSLLMHQDSSSEYGKDVKENYQRQKKLEEWFWENAGQHIAGPDKDLFSEMGRILLGK